MKLPTPALMELPMDVTENVAPLYFFQRCSFVELKVRVPCGLDRFMPLVSALCLRGILLSEAASVLLHPLPSHRGGGRGGLPTHTLSNPRQNHDANVSTESATTRTCPFGWPRGFSCNGTWPNESLAGRIGLFLA